MPEFVNPFTGTIPKEMSHSELVRAIMLDIAAELEAVHLYLAHMDATSDEEAKKVLFSISQEELVHAGEFTSLLYRLDPLTGKKAQEGFSEVADLLHSKAPSEVMTPEGEQATGEPPEPEAEQMPSSTVQGWTVGSLVEKP